MLLLKATRILLAFATLLSLASYANGQLILLHGGDAEPTSGADGAVFDFLVEKLGEDNVTYMEGAQAAADGSSAAGFQAVVISSTLGSGSVRGKYEDSAKPVLQWEEALVDISSPGDFFMSTAAAKPSLTEISILEDHFITAGFEGTVEVTNSPQIFSVGTGDVGEGVRILAAAGDPDSEQHAIMIAEQGGALLGDGSDGSPEFAAARRVHFFLENNTFGDITEDGQALFGRAIDWILLRDAAGNPGDYNDDGMVDLLDFNIMLGNFNEKFPIQESFSKGDENLDGTVNITDFLKFRFSLCRTTCGCRCLRAGTKHRPDGRSDRVFYAVLANSKTVRLVLKEKLPPATPSHPMHGPPNR